jgi:benzil reductase ((S)-benzoin forming)
VVVDLSDVPHALEAIDRAVGQTLQHQSWKRVALVNNAAIGGQLGPLERIDPVELERMMTVNFVVPTYLMGYFVAHTPIAAALRIVNVSSGAAVRAFPGLGAYGGGKAALRMAGMVLAAELESPLRNTPAPRDCAIVSYEPGVVDTDMLTRARELPAEDFPWVQLFRDFQTRGIMVPAEQPAREIVALLDAERLPSFSERRYGVS